MRVPVHDDVAATETAAQPFVPALGPAGVVNYTEAISGRLHDQGLGQTLAYVRFVDVAADGRNRGELLELSQNGAGSEIPGMDDQLRPGEQFQAEGRQSASPPRQMRVGDDGDEGQKRSPRKRPSR